MKMISFQHTWKSRYQITVDIGQNGDNRSCTYSYMIAIHPHTAERRNSQASADPLAAEPALAEIPMASAQIAETIHPDQ